MIRRRAFITLLGRAAVAWPVAARAQQPEKIRRIGILQDLAESDAGSQSEVDAFRGALAKLGWTENRNLQIELRWAAGDSDKMKMLARELVDLRLEVILGRGTPYLFCWIGWPNLLWSRFHRILPPSGRLHRPHPEGHKTRGAADPAADQVRAGHQSQDRQNAWHRGAADAHRPRRRGDRVKAPGKGRKREARGETAREVWR